MKIFAIVLSLIFCAQTSAKANVQKELPVGCEIPKVGEIMGICNFHYIDLPLQVDNGGNMRVQMKVGERSFVPAIFDTGASLVEANDLPNTTEREGATVITSQTSNGDVLEVANDAMVCVALDERKMLCMSAATTFNPKDGDALLGNSFTGEFEHVDIDRKHNRLRFSGRTSEKHLALIIDGVGYKVFMDGQK